MAHDSSGAKNILRRSPLNSRSLHCAPPDFLWRVVALINTVRLSLRRAAYVAIASSAKQEIRVRSGRDDNSVARLECFPVHVLWVTQNCHPDRFPGLGVSVPCLV